MIEVTYKKKNGEIIKRYVGNDLYYRVGYINSYGWECIDIKYCYKGNYYPRDIYYKLQERNYKISRFFYELKKKCFRVCDDIGRLFFLLILFRMIVSATKI